MAAQTVLIVDDDRAIREMLRAVLSDAGYAIVEAADGVEAVDTLLLTSEQLVVLLDLMMPRMTGWDVLALLAQNDTLLHRHSVIVMTANPRALQAHVPSGLSLNAIPVLEKPFDLDALLATVARAQHRLLPAALAQAGGTPTAVWQSTVS